MDFSERSDDNQPFYTPVYRKLSREMDRISIENIYDDRGENLVRNLVHIVNEDECNSSLDLGCGLGQVSISLSEMYKTVVAADISREALKVVAIIAKKKSAHNVHPIIVDAAHLPFRANFFDLLVCSGVLEWVPVNYSTAISPKKCQVWALKEMRRVLSNIGLLWLGIENKYGYSYLLGGLDHHSKLRFVTFLPKPLANIYSKLIKKQPYKNYLYNYWELRKMIQQTGLIISKFQAAFPFYSNPKVVADISNFKEVKKSVRDSQLEITYLNKSIILVVSNLRLQKLLLCDFIVLCAKSIQNRHITKSISSSHKDNQ